MARDYQLTWITLLVLFLTMHVSAYHDNRLRRKSLIKAKLQGIEISQRAFDRYTTSHNVNSLLLDILRENNSENNGRIDPQFTNDKWTFGSANILRKNFCSLFSSVRPPNCFYIHESVLQGIEDTERLTLLIQLFLELAADLEIPVMTWLPSLGGYLQKSERNLLVSLEPSSKDEAIALLDFIKFYKWNSLSVIYNKDSLSSVKVVKAIEAVQKQRNNIQKSFSLHITHPHGFSTEKNCGKSHDRKSKHCLEQYIAILKQQKLMNSEVVYFDGTWQDFSALILATEQESSRDLFDSSNIWIFSPRALAQGVFLNNTVLLHKYLKTKPGLFGLYLNNDAKISSEYLEKAINLWLRSLMKLTSSLADDYQEIEEDTLKQWCDHGNPVNWKLGKSFHSIMRKMKVSMDDEINLAGSKNLTIKNQFLIVNSVSSHDSLTWNKIGQWQVNKNGQNYLSINGVTWPDSNNIPLNTMLEAKQLIRILVQREDPFIIFNELDRELKCSRESLLCRVRNDESNNHKKACCSGFMISFLIELIKDLNINVDLYEFLDTSGYIENQKLQSLFPGVTTGKADMALGLARPSLESVKILDFTVPIMKTGLGVLAERDDNVSMTLLFDPLDYKIWILLLIISVHLVAFIQYLFERTISEQKDANSSDKIETPRSIWITWSIFFGSIINDEIPRTKTAKFLSILWALFSVLFLANYTATFAANMSTNEEIISTIENQTFLENIASATKLGMIANSVSEQLISKQYAEVYNYKSMVKISSLSRAMKLLKSKELEMILYDSKVLQFKASTDAKCELILTKNSILNFDYIIALQKNSIWRDKLNKRIVDYQRNGLIDAWEKKWFPNNCNKQFIRKFRPLTVKNFAILFLILLIGVLACFIVLFFEVIFYKNSKRSYTISENRNLEEKEAKRTEELNIEELNGPGEKQPKEKSVRINDEYNQLKREIDQMKKLLMEKCQEVEMYKAFSRKSNGNQLPMNGFREENASILRKTIDPSQNTHRIRKKTNHVKLLFDENKSKPNHEELSILLSVAQDQCKKKINKQKTEKLEKESSV